MSLLNTPFKRFSCFSGNYIQTYSVFEYHLYALFLYKKTGLTEFSDNSECRDYLETIIKNNTKDILQDFSNQIAKDFPEFFRKHKSYLSHSVLIELANLRNDLAHGFLSPANQENEGYFLIKKIGKELLNREFTKRIDATHILCMSKKLVKVNSSLVELYKEIGIIK